MYEQIPAAIGLLPSDQNTSMDVPVFSPPQQRPPGSFSTAGGVGGTPPQIASSVTNYRLFSRCSPPPGPAQILLLLLYLGRVADNSLIVACLASGGQLF
ncbi:hypothetical protein J6590_044998 [Homalodisca vitripennis]|nr:hypothetical protein J6590_044998 [Homalodisca vitripennis]